MTSAVAFGAVILAGVDLCFVSIDDHLIFNDSASMPRGFYLRSKEPVAPGAIVTVRARDVAGAYARTRHFADDSDRFLKRVAASTGDEICANGNHVSINSEQVVTRALQDSAGRAVPWWSGCRILSADEVLLLGDTTDSFDGRYWGPIRVSQIEGVWRRF